MRRAFETLGKHRLLFASLAAPLMVAGSLFAAYVVAIGQLNIEPAAGSRLAATRPPIVVTSGLPILRSFDTEVRLDGRPLGTLLRQTPWNLTYRTDVPLADGPHTLRIALRARFLPRGLPGVPVRTWSFDIDTTPPEISIENADGEVILAKDEARLLLTAEPGSLVTAKLNEKTLFSRRVSAATFPLKLSGLKDANSLEIIAMDAAGNTGRLTGRVTVDTAPPSITPPRSNVVRGDEAEVTLRVRDEHSYVSSVRVEVDRRKADAVLALDSNTLKVDVSGLLDGKHSMLLKTRDGVGNEAEKTWSFSVDTTKIVIFLNARRLYLYRAGKVVKNYPIAIGMEGYSTPRGHFVILRKRRNPTWVNPGSAWARSMPRVIRPGPGNPLGTRALDISAKGIRIHGTYASGSIGRAASHGCIRMTIRDVEQLFELVSVGTPVHIK